MAEQIRQAFAEAAIAGLPANAFDQFHSYLDLLLRWNLRLNLTAVRDPEQIIRRHFVECAFAAQQLPADIRSLLDYGSGAGFPGVPIAICRPEIRVTLAEAQGKKASFLREVSRALGVASEVYDGRVEEMAGARHFDAVTLRAVDKMNLAIPLAEKRAARYLILFVTEQSAPAYQRLAPELDWRNPIPLPNSEQMMLVIGHKV
jgi:16S rRNA (guanine527-N7)-methyltransferase